MEVINVEKQKILEHYAKMDAKGKSLLEDLLGKEVFQFSKDRIKTFADACKALGIPPMMDVCTNDPQVGRDMVSIKAYMQLIIIARALNQGWEPNWEDSNEAKWFPYFNYKAGFGFTYASCDYWDADTTVGSRLCYKTKELAEYAGKQFQSIYNDFLTLQK